MMRRAIRLLLVCLTAAALLALCACAPASEEAESPVPSESTESPEASDGAKESEEPEVSQEPQVISLDETAKIGALSYGRELYQYRGQDVSRLYYYYIPSTYQEGDKLPLMLTLHGSGSNASVQLQWGQWVECAEREL